MCALSSAQCARFGTPATPTPRQPTESPLCPVQLRCFPEAAAVPLATEGHSHTSPPAMRISVIDHGGQKGTTSHALHDSGIGYARHAAVGQIVPRGLTVPGQDSWQWRAPPL